MNEVQNNENEYDIDNRLADFTDRILNKKNTTVDENPFSQDPELRALEQTALRLKNIFPDEGPSKAVIQHMHQKISMHAPQQERKQSSPFWMKWIHTRQGWRSQRSRQQLRFAISLVTVLILFLISIPLFIGARPDQPAASGQTLDFGILVISIGLFLFAVWLTRRRL